MQLLDNELFAKENEIVKRFKELFKDSHEKTGISIQDFSAEVEEVLNLYTYAGYFDFQEYAVEQRAVDRNACDSSGLCEFFTQSVRTHGGALLKTHRAVLSILMQSWDKSTGDSLFPVPATAKFPHLCEQVVTSATIETEPKIAAAMQQYNFHPKWEGEQLALREELYHHVRFTADALLWHNSNYRLVLNRTLEPKM